MDLTPLLIALDKGNMDFINMALEMDLIDLKVSPEQKETILHKAGILLEIEGGSKVFESIFSKIENIDELVLTECLRLM